MFETNIQNNSFWHDRERKSFRSEFPRHLGLKVPSRELGLESLFRESFLKLMIVQRFLPFLKTLY